MNDLYIMHTQYNLIFAAGLALSHSQTRNVLVLYAEFKVDKAMTAVLEDIFDSVIIVNDEFHQLQRFFRELKHIKECLKKTKSIWTQSFDNVYLAQERVFDLALLGRVKKNNPKMNCVAVEEDAYYSIDNRMNGENYIQTISGRIRLANLIRRLLLTGFPYDHRELVYCYGMSKVYDSAELLFPHLARKELSGKKLIEFTNTELIAGIKAIYGARDILYPESDKYVLIFMDLLNRYNDQQRVKQILEEIVRYCAMHSRKVLLKYHPHETERLDADEVIHELERIVPAEKILLDLMQKDVVVLGNATTVCRVASKVGYKVYSICKIDAPENSKMHEFMDKIGVRCLMSSKEFEE